jgi:site-specific DNA-methyltransferase (adenine-specific)
MTISKALYSSASDDWATPQALFDVLNKQFKFEADMAATKENAKCKEFYSDSLDITWDMTGWLWCNPPYSKIKEFSLKAHDESMNGAKIVMLIPARTDTKYWHDYMSSASEIRFLKGRLKFGDSKNSAPFPSAVVIFDGLDSMCAVDFWDWRL